MIRIGILTRRAGFNIGSSLQAYAISKFITNLGYKCQIIDYDEYSGHKLWKIRPFIENMEWNCIKRISWLKESTKYNYLSIRSNQYELFKQFEQIYLPLTKKKYRSNKNLSEIVDEFDVLVCGSDQIWSPLLYDPVYYFDFLPINHNIKTIAYAPSIGISNAKLITSEQAELIKNIDFISCREEEGAKILENITKKNVPVVLDPTLMLDTSEWNRMADVETHIERPYILCYFLGKNIHQQYIDNLSQQLKCKIFNIQMFNRLNALKADRQISDIGPCEFLRLIRDALWVCTDSFHATIFSYIFKRNLSVFERFSNADKYNQNSRIHSLLRILDIQDSLVPINNYNYRCPLANTKMNSEILKNWQRKSSGYLMNALQA